MPNLWSLPFRWEDTWIETSKERPSLTWVAPACLVRPHTHWGSNHVSSVCIIQTKVLCKQCSSNGSNSHFAVALAKSSFFRISFDTVWAYRHTQFWLPYYNMNPHMVLHQSFYCHGPFSPLKKASDTLAGTAPMSHYLGLDLSPLDSVLWAAELFPRDWVSLWQLQQRTEQSATYGKCSWLFYRQQRFMLLRTTGRASIPAAQLYKSQLSCSVPWQSDVMNSGRRKQKSSLLPLMCLIQN